MRISTETIVKNQTEILKLKKAIIQVKILLKEFNNRLEPAENATGRLEDR